MHRQPWHLPGSERDRFVLRAPHDTPVQAPRLDTSAVREVWHRLQQARQVWLRVPVQERVDRLATLAQCLRREGPAADAALLARSTGLSSQGMAAAWDVTLRPWTAEALRELLQAERWGVGGLEDTGPVPQRLVHILAGNVLPPTWSLLLRSWLLAAATWLRPAAREPLFATCIVRRAAVHEPLLADLTAVTWWPHTESGLDAMAQAVCSSADVITLQGSDASVAAFARSLVSSGCAARFVGYGSRWSAVVVGHADLTRATAAAVAHDIALFDQQGCLSPTQVFGPPGDALQEWAAWLAEALAVEEERMPRGDPGERALAALRHWSETMRLQQVLGRVRRVWHSHPASRWCVVLTQDVQDWHSPLDRHVLVQPVHDADSLRVGFGAQLDRLQGIAVAPHAEADAWVQRLLERLQPSIVQPVGKLQEAPPCWRQDHRAPLRALLSRDLDVGDGVEDAVRDC